MRNKPLYFFTIILLFITFLSPIPFLDKAKTTDFIFLIENIYPQETGSTPAHLTTVNDILFFSAHDGVNDAELGAMARPAITLAMAADRNRAEVGQTIVYTYWITNSGNIDLVNINARDSRLGELPLDQTTLTPREGITKSLSYTVEDADLPGPLVNTATITGLSILGENVFDTADESVILKEISTSPRSTTVYLPILLNPALPPPKKGVGVVSYPACDDVETLKAHWYLNWSYRPDPTCGPENADKFVPRLYDADSIQFLDEAIEHAKASGWLMGFSEPNLPWQGDLHPSQGAVLWRQIETAADEAGIKLVSPSPNQWDPNRDGLPHGHQWTWALVDEYQARFGTKPRFDAIAWNIYKDNPEEIKAYLTARHNEMLARGYDVPVWIIEYGGRCWNSGNYTGNETVMIEVTDWFNQTPWIGRYAWYANRLNGANHNATNYQSCSLVDFKTGDLTPLGQIYVQY